MIDMTEIVNAVKSSGLQYARSNVGFFCETLEIPGLGYVHPCISGKGFLLDAPDHFILGLSKEKLLKKIYDFAKAKEFSTAQDSGS